MKLKVKGIQDFTSQVTAGRWPTQESKPFITYLFVFKGTIISLFILSWTLSSQAFRPTTLPKLLWPRPQTASRGPNPLPNSQSSPYFRSTVTAYETTSLPDFLRSPASVGAFSDSFPHPPHFPAPANQSSDFSCLPAFASSMTSSRLRAGFSTHTAFPGKSAAPTAPTHPTAYLQHSLRSSTKLFFATPISSQTGFASQWMATYS